MWCNDEERAVHISNQVVDQGQGTIQKWRRISHPCIFDPSASCVRPVAEPNIILTASVPSSGPWSTSLSEHLVRGAQYMSYMGRPCLSLRALHNFLNGRNPPECMRF